MPPSSASSSVPRRQLPYNQHNIHILNIITLWNFPILADLDKSYWMVGWMTTMIYIIAIFGGWEKKLLPNSNGDIQKYFSPATQWKKLLSSQICWKKYLSYIENTRPPPWKSTGRSLSFDTVQITFIFIDFRVCDFAFAFKTRNAPCVSRFKRVLFSDRFQFAF